LSLEGRTLGIYRIREELGRGGMGAVYRGESVAPGPAGPAGTTVALKIFHAELIRDDAAFARCKQEAEIGKEIHHANLARSYGIASADLGDERCHFMVMDLIEGRTLRTLLADLGIVPEPLLVEIADQVLAALDALHRRGILHRDIKPENIVITSDHRVLLMDLGVAHREAALEQLQAREFVGSLAYAPPEQFSGQEVSGRSDLYALGITLYELATGRCPFPQKEVGTLVRAKLEGDLPPPRSVHPELDEYWDHLIATSVRSDKAARFASAAELRTILREGESSEWWRLRAAPGAERVLKRLRAERRTPLLGREGEMRSLRMTYEGARERGAALLVRGPGGMGKSRLLYDFLEETAAAGGPAIAAGQAAGQGAVAYGPFLEALADLLRGSAVDLRTRLSTLLGDAQGIVEPLAEFILGELQPSPESGLSKDSLFAAVARIVRTLARERPLVILIDDLHLAGAETVELFVHLAGRVAGAPVLLVGAFADDELPEGSPLLNLAVPGASTIAVGSLTSAATEDLVRRIVRDERTVRALAPALRARSEGNPLVVLEALAHLVQQGILVETDGGLALTSPAEEATLPATVRDLAAWKLAALDEEQREILEVASILGAEFDATLLAEVVGTKLIELLQVMSTLERKHRLVQSAGRTRFRFARRQLFEAVYERVPEALRGEYHSIVADALSGGGESLDGRGAYTLLFHLFHAGRTAEAEPLLALALEHIAASFHASYAAPFLERVAAGLDKAASSKRLAIAMQLWAFYELLASRDDQMRVLDAAQQLADSMGEPGPRARVHALRAGSHWYAGDYERAGQEARTGLDLARQAGDAKWEATCTHTLGVVAYRRGRLEEAATLWREALRTRRQVGDRRGVASTLQALAIVMPSIGEAPAALGTMQEALAAWREIGERRGEAAMLMNIGNHLVDAARYDEGLSHLEQAIEGHRETGALVSEATALNNLGRAQEILGRIDEARASWQRALRLFVDLGVPSGELASLVMLGSALGAYGEHGEARQYLHEAIALAEKSGARARLVNAHREMGELLHAAGERQEGWAHFERALAIEDDLKSSSSRVLTLGLVAGAALREGDSERATSLLLSALPDTRAGRVHAPLILCRLARAHSGAGRLREAEECAREALERLDEGGAVPTSDGPEIYYTLAEILREERLHVRAAELVEQRARQIRNDGYREHFLARTWPNAQIVSRRLT